MTKKKKEESLPAVSGIEEFQGQPLSPFSTMMFGAPDITDLEAPGMSSREHRDAVLKATGKRTTKQKYDTKAERKAAAAERAKKRREENVDFLSELGVGTRKKETLTEEQRKARRSERGKARRGKKKEEKAEVSNFFKQNTEELKKMGWDPTKFKYF